jgi:hypothetical protein
MSTIGALVSAPGEEVNRIFAELDHLGPLRAAPERFTELSRVASSGVGSRGEYLISHLYLHEGVRNDVNAWLARLDIPYEVRVSAIGAGQDAKAIGDVVALILHDRRSGLEVSPKDVGFGISQLLPIVAHLLDARQSVTCVEQPEIHVHPRLQAELADLLIEATSEERGNQVIIETHSEHLMLRLQRRIRAGVLDAERVSVLYVDVDNDGVARIDRLRLDEDGNFIDPWPHGFFDERLDELFGGDE